MTSLAAEQRCPVSARKESLHNVAEQGIPPAPIHADRNPFLLEHADEGLARELRSLIAVGQKQCSVAGKDLSFTAAI